MQDSPTIIGGFNTDDVKRRLEQCARAGSYHVSEWLTPMGEGESLLLRVMAAVKIGGREYERGFGWDGDDLNDLVSRAMALDLVMTKLPELASKGMLPEQRKDRMH